MCSVFIEPDQCSSVTPLFYLIELPVLVAKSARIAIDVFSTAIFEEYWIVIVDYGRDKDVDFSVLLLQGKRNANSKKGSFSKFIYLLDVI